jgi:hypothetical protein
MLQHGYPGATSSVIPPLKGRSTAGRSEALGWDLICDSLRLAKMYSLG